MSGHGVQLPSAAARPADRPPRYAPHESQRLFEIENRVDCDVRAGVRRRRGDGQRRILGFESDPGGPPAQGPGSDHVRAEVVADVNYRRARRHAEVPRGNLEDLRTGLDRAHTMGDDHDAQMLEPAGRLQEPLHGQGKRPVRYERQQVPTGKPFQHRTDRGRHRRTRDEGIGIGLQDDFHVRRAHGLQQAVVIPASPRRGTGRAAQRREDASGTDIDVRLAPLGHVLGELPQTLDRPYPLEFLG